MNQKEYVGPFVQDAIITWNEEGYLELEKVLYQAYQRASQGKGKDRHASGEPFDAQPICTELLALGSITPALFQARKKILESLRLPPDMAINELLDAINYIAAAVIVTQAGE